MNWYGSFRSNYFKVKGPQEAVALKMLCRWNDIEYQENDGMFALFGDEAIPMALLDENGDEVQGKEFIQELGALLADDEVAILIEHGAEGKRYITGGALAVTRDDDGSVQLLSVNLNDIYGMVKHEWGINPSRAEY